MADGNMLANWAVQQPAATSTAQPQGPAATHRREYTFDPHTKFDSNTVRIIMDVMDAMPSASEEVTAETRVLVVAGLVGIAVALLGMGLALSDRTRGLTPVALVGFLMWIGAALALRDQHRGDG